MIRETLGRIKSGQKLTPCKWKGCGVPGAFTDAGSVISILLRAGSGMTLPEGRRSCARCAPLRIWSSTGTVGGANDALLMKKFVPFCLRTSMSA